MTRSALYPGIVTHQRLRPKPHRLRYRVFTLLLDLDELPALDAGSRLFGHNRAAVLSFRDSDHGDGTEGGLRPWVERQLAEIGIDAPAPRIELLCYPRLLGYVFNPLTVYFCRDAEGHLIATLYEVANTFGERHTYVMAADDTTPLRQSCAKRFHVSPFLPMDCAYHFTTTRPGDQVGLAIRETDAEGTILTAAFTGERRAFSDVALLRVLLTHPLMTLKVTAAIHWEALRLWLKGTPVYTHVPAAQTVAVSHSGGRASSPAAR